MSNFLASQITSKSEKSFLTSWTLPQLFVLGDHDSMARPIKEAGAIQLNQGYHMLVGRRNALEIWASIHNSIAPDGRVSRSLVCTIYANAVSAPRFEPLDIYIDILDLPNQLDHPAPIVSAVFNYFRVNRQAPIHLDALILSLIARSVLLRTPYNTERTQLSHSKFLYGKRHSEYIYKLPAPVEQPAA